MYEVGPSSQCVKVNSRKCGQICTGVGLLKTRGTSNKGELSTKQELGLIELLLKIMKSEHVQINIKLLCNVFTVVCLGTFMLSGPEGYCTNVE